MTVKISIETSVKDSQLELYCAGAESECASSTGSSSDVVRDSPDPVRRTVSRSVSRNVVHLVRSISVKTLNNRIRLFKTLVTCCTFFGLGLSMSLVGPTLLDLQVSVAAPLKHLNWIFSINAFGYIVGTIFAGVTLSRFNVPVCLAVYVLVLAMTDVATPWCRSLVALFSISWIMNVAGGALDAGCNYWTLKLWGDDNAPYMQALHFTYGLGALVAPLISEPFLLPEGNKSSTLTADLIQDWEQLKNLKIYIPYSAAGALCGLIVIMYAVVTFLKPGSAVERIKSSFKTPLSRWRKMATIGALALFSMGFAGVETVMPRYLTTFAVKSSYGMSASDGALLTSAFWAAYTFSRLGSVFLAPRLGLKRMLQINMALILAGCAFCLCCGSLTSPLSVLVGYHRGTQEVGLWLGTILVGVGSSSVFPLQYGLLEQVMPVSTWMASAITLVFSLGTFSYPLAIGNLIETDPMILFYVTGSCSLWSCAWLAAFQKLGRV